MKITLYPLSEIQVGDNLTVTHIAENELDMVSMKYSRVATLALDNYLQEACMKLLEYRKRNTTNFQLEKLDDFLNEIERLLRK